MSQMNPIELARSRMMLRYVFFASLIMATELVELKDCPSTFDVDRGDPTAATDMRKIYYNAAFMESLSPDVAMFVLAHEMMHIMLKHGLRRNGRDPEIWNIAADFAINIILRDHGFKLWQHCWHDKFPADNPKTGQKGTPVNWTGKSAEEIYNLIMEELKKNPQAGGTGGGNMDKDLREPGDLDGAAQGALERQIDQKIAQAAMAAKLSGQLSAQLDQLVQGILNPPLTWQELLREFATRVTNDNESWNHRNRRIADVYLPSRRNLTMGELVGIGDTSGSLTGSGIFAQIGAEIEEIREQVKPERIRWIWADDEECNLEQIFEADEEVMLTPKGGGGTDMRRPLKHIEQFDPVVGILVTDGYTPWPEEATPFPLIILCNTDQECPDWALTIRIKDAKI